VIVAGSTHPGEDEIICKAYKMLRRDYRGLRLILVPRHIERAARLARTLEALGLMSVRKSALDSGFATASVDDVLLIDTIGDLALCYSLATCVFVGRSLLPPGGGQNMMEPAALGRPVIVGPYTGNFEPEMKLLAARGAAVVVRSGTELLREMRRLLGDHGAAQQLGQNARSAVIESQGAAERTLERLEQMLAGSALAR
jgi:3-deoxy-D-manno-octulosonic-acid transferase